MSRTNNTAVHCFHRPHESSSHYWGKLVATCYGSVWSPPCGITRRAWPTITYSRLFEIHSGVKQGCVVAATLFGIFSSLMLSYAFDSAMKDVSLHTWTHGKRLSLAHLIAKIKDAVLNTRIGQAASVMPKLNKRVGATSQYHIKHRTMCLSSAPFCETWTTYTRQEKILNSFHLRCIRRILGKFWQDMVTNSTVLDRPACIHY